MKGKVLVSAMVFLLVFLAMAPMAHADGPVTSLNPTDDSYVDWPSTTANFGSLNHLLCESGRTYPDGKVVRRSYLTFVVSGIVGTISKAVLKLFCYGGWVGPLDVEAHKTGDGWSETLITWGNAPAVGELITTTSETAMNKWYSWDVTSYVVAEHAGDKIVSVVMTLHNDYPPWETWLNGRWFDSKEGPNKPVLEITYSPPEGLPEFGVNVAIITSIAAALIFALKRLRK